ncbi:hypothetical protein KMW28_00795 [Flammeovirga yaeyamensis]|uniref:Uncharacterized protein n=1 Tax=Flammeovirga yaeyamensis TaxID=367791 RepID=A0AAX1N804_9BACT|nr:hypothetical protein [Flammeovirga yaeyamensis]MBB3699620.1 hypothetical protein [Flammeovirga yaeyamensis]NMF36808.1 hypothetical protein [Flammeovirga yaeyamensis]QWG02152.1 hypothetical protein KMW28_00795 [Flammeovirga yaeyamensis]
MFIEKIYELPLEHNLGYFLVGIIEPEVIGLKGGFIHYSHLMNVYDTYSSTPFEKNANEDKKLKELMPPFVISRKPKSRGRNKWREIGKKEISLDNYRLPEFYQSKEIFYPDVKSQEWWMKVSRVFINDSSNSDYEKIKHLAPWVYINFPGLSTVVTMYYLQKNGVDILDYYGDGILNDPLNHDFNVRIYNWVKNLPDYSKVPEEIRWIENVDNIKY